MKNDIQKIKICVLGDNNVGITSLIQAYIQSSGEKNIIAKGDYKKFEKCVCSSRRFMIDLFEFNCKNDKIISIIQECQGCFLVFDMNNRESFENLLDNWLTFLRDDCTFANQVVILGNYTMQEGRTSLLTSEEEIYDMIKMSEIDAKFFQIGSLDNENVNMLLDKLILEAYETEQKTGKGRESKDQSLKKCPIF